MPICSVNGCERPARTLGLCNMHALRFKKYGTTDPGPKAQMPLEERFWRFVEKLGPDDCWPWKGNRLKFGYGRIGEGGSGGKSLSAHRVSFEMHYGHIPDGKCVMHSCDNPECVNPSHLTLGTSQENTADRVRKSRSAINVVQGTENGKSVLTPDLVRYIRRSSKSASAVGKEIGVSKSCVIGVRIGRTWSHVK